MYVYPNPLNSNLGFFFNRKIIVMKKHDTEKLSFLSTVTHEIHREDKYDNTFLYSVLDIQKNKLTNNPIVLKDIFSACKKRRGRNRVASMPKITKD